ncbi:hypothetical protein M8J77_013799 [Diaphorina citri]|nr:hypothetical protein M8J77_013799 [Diaphorina citri]
MFTYHMLAPVAMRIYMSELLIFLTRLSGPRNSQSRNQSFGCYKFRDPAGNRTRVSRVQGVRSDHYAMGADSQRIERNKKNKEEEKERKNKKKKKKDEEEGKKKCDSAGINGGLRERENKKKEEEEEEGREEEEEKEEEEEEEEKEEGREEGEEENNVTHSNNLHLT